MDTLRWQAGTLFLLDQTKLPFEEIYLPCHSWQDVRQAISVLAVRGAPAIGVAAAYAVVLAARSLCQKGGDTPFLTALEAICQDLDAARPTAVNLHWALTQMMVCARQHEADGAEAVTAVLEEKAIAIHEADVAINTAMARFGADELEKLGRPLTLLTHCNAGALATAGVGTALGVILVALVNNVFIMFNGSPNWSTAISGIMLLVAVALDLLRATGKKGAKA